MKPIILASASAQRKELLKLTGIKVIVRPSRVKEVQEIKGTCSSLVKHNALLKARDVAAKFKKGVVIGADTIVYGGKGQVIGKPRNLKEAKKILKDFFSRPHWVYSGVAVIDVETKKTLVDYEKTKVYMHKLSDQEIDRYHKVTSPLDKAGGFDIEGRGGLFIKRIEGCYSNVIGLPMAKLRVMLKKVGVSILGVLLMISSVGCTTEYNLATGRQETLMYGTEKEVKVGDAIARQIDANYEIINDIDVNERLQRILDRLVAVGDRKDIVYTIKAIDEDEINAVSLPGGYIYVFNGLMDKLETDDQLAGVIAHELGHITAKHSMKRLQSSYSFMVLQVLAASSGNTDVAQGVNALYVTAFYAYSQEDELEADRLAVKYTKKAGYDPRGMLDVLDVLRKESPMRRISYFRTHPHIPERKAALNMEITGELEFADYLNLTGNE